jgi:hypothetical protein
MDLVTISYVFDFLIKVKGLVIILLAISIAAFIMSPFIAEVVTDEEKRLNKSVVRSKIIKISLIVFLVSSIFYSVIPSDRTFYIYVGSKISKEISSKKDANVIFKKTLELIEKRLDKSLSDEK